MPHQQGYVFPALAQRWQSQTHSADPVVKIFPKIPRPNFRLQITGASANQPRHGPGPAAILISPCQSFQHPCLALRAQLGNFFKIDRSRSQQTGLLGRISEVAGTKAAAGDYAKSLLSTP